jgi:hypothetical protein
MMECTYALIVRVFRFREQAPLSPLFFAPLFVKLFASSSPMIALFALLSLASLAAGHGDEDHDHEESCACVAKELDFKIDCSNMAVVNASFAALGTNACLTGTTCKTNKACEKDFAIVLSHHDHCLAGVLPTSVEDGLHNYEDVCEPCHINRAFDPKLTPCPAVNCSDSTGHAAAIAFLKDAANNCKSTACAANCTAPWKRLRLVHDTCEENDIPRDAEALLHELEDSCAANDCNAFDKEAAPVCEEKPAPAAVDCKTKSCADCVKAADACSWCDSGRATAEKAGSSATWTSTGTCTQGTKCTAEKVGLEVKFTTCKDGSNAAATALSLAAVAVSVALRF